MKFLAMFLQRERRNVHCRHRLYEQAFAYIEQSQKIIGRLIYEK